MFFSGLGVFFGIYKTCESLDKASSQPFVRFPFPCNCNAGRFKCRDCCQSVTSKHAQIAAREWCWTLTAPHLRAGRQGIPRPRAASPSQGDRFTTGS